MNLTQKQLDPILFRTEETGREIEFTLLDPDGTAYDLTDYDMKFSMLKPDGNFIYQDLSAGILTQTEQMTTARGIGYYAIRVSDQDTLIYTGQGKVVIDDHVITDETLNSISEVDGLTFPDDFLTVDSPVAVIDDTVTTNNKTWSSSKIINAIGDAVEDFHDFVIDDEAITPQATWSSDKLYAMFNSIKHDYSTAEQIVGKWIDGSAVYEKTIVSEFTNHAENYTLDLSEIDGTPILLIDISSAVCIYTEGSDTYTQIVQPASNNTNTYSIVINHGSATADTLIGYVTIRYIKY